MIVRMTDPLTEIVDPLPTRRELQVRLPSTVNVKPVPITISSPTAGIVPPGHGAFGVVELQLPLPVVVIVAALDTPATSKNIIKERAATLCLRQKTNTPNARSKIPFIKMVVNPPDDISFMTA